MKIAQMHRNLGTGGIEAMVCGLSNELARSNDVTVCTIVAPSPDDKFYKELVPEIKRETIGRTGEGKPLKEMFHIAHFVKKGQFDIVHIHGFFYYYALAILFFHKKTCFCYTIHSDAMKENNPWDLRIFLFKRFCFRKGWLHPITISPTCQRSFFELYGCESRVILNGVVRPRPGKENALSSLRASSETKVFLHASRICPEKNQVMLCEVFEMLIKEKRDVALAIAGPIHHHEIYNQMNSFFSERIQYIGDRDDIPALLCEAEGMCLTSLYEGLPIILLESLAAGCVPICTPVGGILDVIQNGENGVLSSEVSVESYYSAIRYYLDLPKESVEKMKEACLQSAREYDIAQTGQNYLSYYKELVRK